MTYDELYRNANVRLLDEYSLTQVFDNIMSQGKPSVRTVKPEGYKAPERPSKLLTEEELYSYHARILTSIIKKIKADIKTYGKEEEFEYLSKHNPALTRPIFEQIITMTDAEIFATVKYDTVPFLRYWLNRCTYLNAEHNGSVMSEMYRTDYEVPMARIYLNAFVSVVQDEEGKGIAGNDSDRLEFLTLYITKCIERGLPIDMKGSGAGKSSETGKEIDTVVLYTDEKSLPKNIEVLEEIARERPDLIAKFGSPVATGSTHKFYTVSSAGPRYKGEFKDKEKQEPIVKTKGVYTATHNDMMDIVCLKTFLRVCGRIALADAKVSSRFRREAEAILGPNYEEELRKMQDSDEDFRGYDIDAAVYGSGYMTVKGQVEKLSALMKHTARSKESLVKEMRQEIPKTYASLRVDRSHLKPNGYGSSVTTPLTDLKYNLFENASASTQPICYDIFMYEEMMREREAAIEIILTLRSVGKLKKIVKENFPAMNVPCMTKETLVSCYIEAVGLEEFIKAFEITQRLNEDLEASNQHFTQRDTVSGKVYKDYDIPDYAAKAFQRKLEKVGKKKEREAADESEIE